MNSRHRTMLPLYSYTRSRGREWYDRDYLPQAYYSSDSPDHDSHRNRSRALTSRGHLGPPFEDCRTGGRSRRREIIAEPPMRRPRQITECEENYDPRSSSSVRRTSSVRMPMKEQVPIERAMTKLFKCSMKAEEEYNNFQRDFENDTNAIRSYTTLETLSNLWKHKMAGRRYIKDSEDNYQSGENENSRRPFEKFRELRKQLTRALQEAVDSSWKEAPGARKNDARHKSARRLIGKVFTAREQILDLLDQASDSREELKALVKELVQLRTLIDPASEQNSELFRPVEEDDDQTNVDDDCDDDDDFARIEESY